MSPQPPVERVAIVVHPTRTITEPLAVLREWTARHDLDLVQIPAPSAFHRHIGPHGTPQPGDLIVALGGDGTVLAALRASAAAKAPVLGVACGSLGALAAVPSGELATALDRFVAGDWTPRDLPALAIEQAGGAHEWAVNDFVAVRHAAGQLVVEVTVDDELYVRVAGDGVVVATPLGSSAYSMAVGGPIVASGTQAFVVTPLAMHGGSAAPLVVPSTSSVQVVLRPGFAGFEIEIDGQAQALGELEYRIGLHPDKVRLVTFDGPSLGLTGLRERKLITDSPRVLARDARQHR